MSFQFGNPNAPSTNPQPVFGFNQPQQTGGFSFGQPSQPSQTQGFGFGTSPPSSGFTFGSTPGFSFGTPPPATTTSAFGFGSGLTTNAGTGGGSSIFGTATTSGTSGFSFGTPATSTGFSFGTPIATTSSGGFGFGTPNNPASTGTGFASGFSATPQTGSSFALNAPKSISSSFGTPNLTFGTPTTSTNTNTGFNFSFDNSANTSNVATIQPFGFGVTPTTTAQTAVTTSGSSAFAFSGTGSGFGFGLSQPVTSQPDAKQKTVTFDLSGSSQPNPAQGSSGFVAISTPSTDTQSQPKIGGFVPSTTIPSFFSAPTSATTTGFSFGLPMTSTSSLTQTKSIEPITSNAPISAFGMSGTSVFSQPSTATATTSIFPIITSSSSAPSISVTSSTFAVQTTVAQSVSSVSVTPTTVVSTVVTCSATISTPTAFAVSLPPVTSAAAAISSTTVVSSTSLPSSTVFAPTTTAPAMSLFPAVPSITSVGTGFPLPSAVTIAATTVASLTTATTVTSSTVTPSPVMNFRQLEEAINKWNLELEEQERIFLNQATEVNAWDHLLTSNGEKITTLNEAVAQVKTNQQRLDHELDFIVSQQRELEEILVPLEKSVEGIPNLSIQQHADLEREHTYHLAENIDAQLKQMTEDIKEIIEHLNTKNSNQDENDPIHQVAKILNTHMDALQWIEQNTTVVQRKLDEVSKLYENKKNDQEKFQGRIQMKTIF